ncbi:MAG TPA: hypothetical protein PKD64_16430 [Pirellulaceae bacterium]|nr:hypothetical protein [Pirellulaceae bacterium]HMO93777.1 hypothetical protein [Pirellulaceae bacterium]
MSKLLSKLSLLLTEEQPSLTWHDVEELLGSHQHFLLDAKVIVPTRPASNVACDACHLGHVEEVVRVKLHDSRVVFRIPCEEAGWVEIAEENLRRWTIDFRCLVRNLALGLSPAASPIELLPGLAWSIGAVQIEGKVYRLVLLNNTQVLTKSQSSELRYKVIPTGTILIAIGDQLFDETGFAAAMPLFSAFEAEEDRLVLRAEFLCEMVISQSNEAEQIFRLRGEFWQLRYGGTTVFVKGTVGLGYIARLLTEPNRDITAVQLLAARAGIDPLITIGSSGEVLDEQTKAEYGRRYRELLQELEEARANNDFGQIDQLEKEKDMLTSELARAFGLSGRSRKKTDAEKIRNSVSMAVARDIQRINEHHSELARHLTVSITSGQVFRYAPEKDICWVV